MNYGNFIVKIVGKPEQSFFENNICITEVLVKLCQIKKNKLEVPIKLTIWGNLGYDIMQYYHVNDYIIIEGYISFSKSSREDSRSQAYKQIKISVFKIYPFFLKNVEMTESIK